MGVLGTAVALALLVGGCGGGSGDSNRVNVGGEANFPVANGGDASPMRPSSSSIPTGRTIR